MIQFEQVHKSFNGTAVLKGISMEIPDKRRTVILGASGSGKSVILKHITGLLKPDSGRVMVAGVDTRTLYGKELASLRRKTGMLFQGAALFDSLNVFDNIALPLRYHGIMKEWKIEETIREMLDLVGMRQSENLMPAELSGGMRKRIGLARALVMKPEYMLYDEPTTGLDPETAMRINQLILDINQQLSVTSIIVTHDMDCVRFTAEFIRELCDGIIGFTGSYPEFAGQKNL
jgi:phospholipid/cholesterol/gamma-HCH transport system ATP-binding protein